VAVQLPPPLTTNGDAAEYLRALLPTVISPLEGVGGVLDVCALFVLITSTALRPSHMH
jgi:hypothetical protein